MSRRRRPVVVALPARPPMPMTLGVFDVGAWGSPADGEGWEAAAYQRHVAARDAWLDEFGHLPVPVGPVDDEPFCGELTDHDCQGADC